MEGSPIPPTGLCQKVYYVIIISTSYVRVAGSLIFCGAMVYNSILMGHAIFIHNDLGVYQYFGLSVRA